MNDKEQKSKREDLLEKGILALFFILVLQFFLLFVANIAATAPLESVKLGKQTLSLEQEKIAFRNENIRFLDPNILNLEFYPPVEKVLLKYYGLFELISKLGNYSLQESEKLSNITNKVQKKLQKVITPQFDQQVLIPWIQEVSAGIDLLNPPIKRFKLWKVVTLNHVEEQDGVTEETPNRLFYRKLQRNKKPLPESGTYAVTVKGYVENMVDRRFLEISNEASLDAFFSMYRPINVSKEVLLEDISKNKLSFPFVMLWHTMYYDHFIFKKEKKEWRMDSLTSEVVSSHIYHISNVKNEWTKEEKK